MGLHRGAVTEAALLARRSARDRTRREIDDRLFRLHALARSPRTREPIVARYLGLARHLATRYAAGPEPWDDLFQVASLALVRAIDRYDPDRPATFTSFAVPTIEGELKRHFRDRCWTVRPPRPLQELAQRIERTRTSLAADRGRPVSTAEVARELGLEEPRLDEAIAAQRLMHVEPLSTRGDGDAVAARTLLEEEGYAQAEHRATLAPMLAGLSARDREIIRLRYVEDRTQQEIADVVGVSQMQVSRILAVSLRRLQDMAEAA